MRRFIQSVNVFVQPEHQPMVGPDPLKNPVAVKQSVVKHGDLGVVFVHKLTIKIHLHDNPLFFYSLSFPSRIKNVRCAIFAISLSCVTIMNVCFFSLFSRPMSSMTSRPLCESRFPVGSSHKTMAGSFISAL